MAKSGSDPGVVTVRPFELDDLERAADFCERARLEDPSIEPFSQRLALIATGPRAMLPLWQVAEGEDRLLYGIAFAAVREQRESASSALGKVSSRAEEAELQKKPPPELSRPPRQPYAGAPSLKFFAGGRVNKPPAVLPVAPEMQAERKLPPTLQPAKPRERELVLKPAAPRENKESAPLDPQRSPPASLPAPKPQRTTLEMYAAVQPSLRRQGLGRALVEPLLHWVQSASEPVALRARVNDAPGSQAGIAFLKALQFEPSIAQLTLSWNQTPIESRELPALQIRQLGAKDSAGVAQLASLSDAAWAGAPDAFQTRADELAQLMSELGRLVILATAQGRAVGYLSGVWLGKTLGIEEVAVLPEFRQAGIGRALVVDALGRGARAAVLSVSEENRPARAMYRSLGFAQTARKQIFTLRGGPS